jgi:hypothetical protein
VVLGVVALFIVFVVTRLIILRYTGHSTVANVTGAAIVIAFALGSFAQTFRLPQPESAAAPPAAAQAQATGAADAGVRDVSARCRTMTRVPESGAIGAFDALVGANGTSPVVKGAALAGDAAYVATGWGADREGKAPAAGICLLVDGKVALRATSLYGTSRPDVAQATNVQQLGQAGFRIIIPPHSLRKGARHIAVAVQSQDGSFALASNSWDVVIR